VKVSPASASVALKVPTVVAEAAFSATEVVFKAKSVGAVLKIKVTVAVVLPPLFVAVIV
jgi:hypothetical protein